MRRTCILLIPLKYIGPYVAVRKRQVAILARSYREMSQTVRIATGIPSSNEFAPQFGLAIFV